MNALEIDLLAARMRNIVRSRAEFVLNGCDCGGDHPLLAPTIVFFDNEGDELMHGLVSGDNGHEVGYRDTFQAAWATVPHAIMEAHRKCHSIGAVLVAQQCRILIATENDAPGGTFGHADNDPRFRTALAVHLFTRLGVTTSVAPLELNLDGNPRDIGEWRHDLRACKPEIVERIPFAEKLIQILKVAAVADEWDGNSNRGEVLPDA